MSRTESTIHLYLLEDRGVDLDHAALVVKRLGALRSVDGGAPEWHVLYETRDLSEAMRMCAADLDALDPRWLETFDFSASRPGRRDRWP